MSKRHKKIIWKIILIVFIAIVATIFRGYKLDKWMFFGMDQEYEALIVKNIITGKHLPLIGVNASDTGLYLGPAFIYFAAIPFWLFSGNPFGWALTSFFIGTFVCFAIYVLGSKMFNGKVGFYSALIYASSALISFYDRQFWNPTLIPMFSLFIGYLLYRIKSGHYKNLVYLSIVFSIAIQCHLSILIFAPLIILTLFQLRSSIPIKLLLVSILGFLFFQIPIIIFELRHNFLNLRAIVHMIVNQGNNLISYSSIFTRSGQFFSSLGRILYLPPSDFYLQSGQCKQLINYVSKGNILSIFLVLFCLALLIWHILDRKKFSFFNNSNLVASKIIVNLFCLTGLTIIFYNREIFEYYYLYLFPWVALTIGWSCYFFSLKKYGKYLIFSLLFFYFTLNLLSLFSSTFSYAYNQKIEALNFVKSQLNRRSYNLIAVGGCAKYGGYRYLSEFNIYPPSYSYMDNYFSWLYYDENVEKSSTYVLLSLIDFRESKDLTVKLEEEKEEILNGHNITSQGKFGDIEVYIMK